MASGKPLIPDALPNIRARYSLRSGVLGEGYMGVVRVCVERSTGRKFACKTILKGKLSPAGEADIRREVAALRAMAGCPYSVALREVYEDGGAVHLVMDLCEGTLYEYICRRKRLTEQEAMEIFRQIVDGVAACHERGWMHRDLKPENVLLVRKRDVGPLENIKNLVGFKSGVQGEEEKGRAGRGVEVKITDFGLSMEIGSRESFYGLAGSAMYVAPEVVLGLKYGLMADMWSLGIMLYALLLSDVPFKGANDKEVLRLVATEQVRMEGPAWSALSKGAQELLGQLLRREPKERPTAAEVQKHPWLGGGGRREGGRGVVGVPVLGRRESIDSGGGKESGCERSRGRGTSYPTPSVSASSAAVGEREEGEGEGLEGKENGRVLWRLGRLSIVRRREGERRGSGRAKVADETVAREQLLMKGQS